jgi:ribosomal protein S18 acetylase RimI-like enzyme
MLEPVTAATASAVRSLAVAALSDSRYAEPLMAALDGAIAGISAEYRALAARRNDDIIGLVVFGYFAGVNGAGRIYLVVVDSSARERGIARRLVGAACEELAASGARFALMELPGEQQFATLRRLALGMGFREEGRLDDYHRDGVPILFLRRDLAPAQ